MFAAYAAPIALSGSATFAGYTILGDTAVHFMRVDRVSTAGANLDGLAPSSYRETLSGYLGGGYPLGAHAALAATRPLVLTDVAWVFQPFLSFVRAMLALILVGLVRGVVGQGWRAAAVAAIAAQPALVYGYALQGSIKEVATLMLVPLIAATVGLLARPATDSSDGILIRARELVPLAVVVAAAYSAIGLAVLAWLGPMLLVAACLFAYRHRDAPQRALVPAAGFVAVAAALSLPTLLDARDYVTVAGAS